MKRSGNYYDVMHPTDGHGLVIRHNERFDDVVEEINDIVYRSKERGYNNDEKWIIVLVEWETEYGENGFFIQQNTHRQAVAFYDNGIVTDL